MWKTQDKINIFSKSFRPDITEKRFVVKEVKNTTSGKYMKEHFKGREISRKLFINKNWKIVCVQNQKSTKKSNIRCVKWKGYDNSINGQINATDIA